MRNLDEEIGGLISELTEVTPEHAILPSDDADLYGISFRHLSGLENDNISEADIVSALRIYNISQDFKDGLLAIVHLYFRAGESSIVVQHKLESRQRKIAVRESVVRGQDSRMRYHAV